MWTEGESNYLKDCAKQLIKEGQVYPSLERLAEVLYRMMRRVWPNYKRTHQAIVHRLRKLKLEFHSRIARDVINLVTPKKLQNNKNTTPSSKSSSNNSADKKNKRKRSDFNSNKKYLGVHVASSFEDVNDNNNKKIYTGIIILYLLLLLLYIIIIYIFLFI